MKTITLTLTEEEAGVVTAALDDRLVALTNLSLPIKSLIGEDRIDRVRGILSKVVDRIETEIHK